VAVGDSHHQGTSTTTQFWNYLLRSTVALNARYKGQVPFGYWTTAQGAADSELIFGRLNGILEVARPSFVVLPGWTYNEKTLTVHADHIANMNFFSRLLMASEACVRAGAVPIFLTPFPRDARSMTPVQLRAWRALHTAIASLRDSGAMVLDAASILTHRTNGALDGTYRSEYSDDEAHPNDAGHAAVSAALTPMIERVCGLSSATLA
jgi:hypothetical protein